MDLGISKTREKFKERRFAGSSVEPTLWVSPNVPTFLFEIMRYAYNPKTLRPMDKDDHMCENLRRLVLTELTYIAPPTDRDYIRPNHNISFNEVAIVSRQ